MTSRSQIEAAIRSAYAARIAEDLPAMLSHFVDDACFAFNGPGVDAAAMNIVCGRAAIETVLKNFVDSYKLADWKEITLLVDGDRAALHWSAKVTATQSGLTDTFHVFDLFTFRGDKIVELRQSTDTAKMMTVSGL